MAVDMTAPGVEVRPLVTMTGEAEFNEVFLDEVFVPDDQLIGEVHQGWRVANTTLAHERGTTFPFKEQVVHEVYLGQLLDLAADHGLARRPVGGRPTGRRLRQAPRPPAPQLADHDPTGPGRGARAGVVVVKLAWTDMTQPLSDAGLAVVGDAAPLWGRPTRTRTAAGGSGSGSGARPRPSPGAPRRSSAPSSASGSWGCPGDGEWRTTRHVDRLFVGGRWEVPSTGDTLDVVEAHTEQVLGRVPVAGPRDVERAVDAARTAFDDSPWPTSGVEERIEAVGRIAAGMASGPRSWPAPSPRRTAHPSASRGSVRSARPSTSCIP